MAVENSVLAPVSDASSSILSAWMGPADTGAPDDPRIAPDEASTAPDDPRTLPDLNRQAELERLGDRIAELSARIQAATYELLVLVREFDARSGWSGCTSCAHWLSWCTGLAPGAAREHVRVARALGNLPKLSDAMRRGVVSYSKVRAVTRVASPETEEALLDVAKCGTAAHVEQVVRGWRRVDRIAEQTEEKRRQEKRSLRTWVDDDGMVIVQGRLTPEVGAVLRRALEAACDQMRARGESAADESEHATAKALAQDVAAVEEEQAPTFAHRQADAIGLLAECALGSGLDRGTAGDRYQVVVHVDAGTLAEENDVPAGTSERAASDASAASGTGPPDDGQGVPAGTYRSAELESERAGGAEHVPAGTPVPAPASAAAHSQTVLDEAGGIHVSAETARRLACDAAIVTMQHGPGGEILDVGRRTRTISPALRRALAARDRQCRFPGCQNRRCDAHHVEHWADGGATSLENLVLLCRRHHRVVHEEGFRITLDATGEVEFTRPDGRPFPAAPPQPLWTGAPLAPVTDRLDQDGVAIDSRTAAPAWRGEQVDINWVVDSVWQPRSEGSERTV